MKAFYAGLSAIAVFSVCATTAASAMVGPTVSSALALARARSMANVPNMNGLHTFTIITRSKADKDVAAVASYFRTFGMAVETLPATKNLHVTGTYAQASQAGHTSLQLVHVRGESVVRSTQHPSFPPAIASLVAGTSIAPGLHFRPLSIISAPKLETFYGPANGYGPADIAGIYDITPVYNAGDIGQGANVAIAACTDVTIADVKQYGLDFGLPPLQYKKTFVGGAQPPPGTLDGEAILDAERVYGTAPGAKIYQYLAPDCTDAEIIDVFTQIAEDSAKYHFSGVSFSYGANETDYALLGVPQDLIDTSAAIAELAAAGVPLFASSGDSGSWAFEFQTDVSFPASDTNAIAVGGTTVLETVLNTRLSETGWTGSGGGVSSVFSIPAFQAAIAGPASGIYRNVPDVSMLADPATGAAMYAPDAFGVAGEFPIGGTSVSAPTFNGVWALLNSARYAVRRGNMKHPAAMLYAHTRDFVDVTIGDNGAYNAKPGYDNMTGIGVPDVAKLVHDAAH